MQWVNRNINEPKTISVREHVSTDYLNGAVQFCLLTHCAVNLDKKQDLLIAPKLVCITEKL